jgi:hypothetical protein
MAGGSLTITVENYSQLPAVAQRVLCWMSAGNRGNARINTAASPGSGFALVIPEESFGAGSLVLRRGGTDLVSGYVAGTNISFNATNGTVVLQNVNTCPASTNQPTVSSFVTNVGGNPLATTLNYANVGSAGTVNIDWGDGTTTAGAAESGASNHTYPNNGLYTITISDVTSPTDLAQVVVHVP